MPSPPRRVASWRSAKKILLFSQIERDTLPVMSARIIGIDRMGPSELNFELQRGGKFVTYYYCISIIVMTFRRGSDIYFIKTGESPVSKGLPWTLISLLLGWWGIPWGPIWTIQSLAVNFRGGKDVTGAVVNALSGGAGSGAAAG